MDEFGSYPIATTRWLYSAQAVFYRLDESGVMGKAVSEL